MTPKPHIRLMRPPPNGTLWRRLWLCTVRTGANDTLQIGVGETPALAYEEMLRSLCLGVSI